MCMFMVTACVTYTELQANAAWFLAIKKLENVLSCLDVMLKVVCELVQYTYKVA